MPNSNRNKDFSKQKSIFFDTQEDLEKESDDSYTFLEKPTPVQVKHQASTSSNPFSKVEVDEPQPPLCFISFGSGSSGNCSYVGTTEQGVLIDAGIDVDKVFDTLAANGIKPEMVKGICLTHDHADHIRFAYKIARKYKHLRLYCTRRVLDGILRRHNVSRRIKDIHEAIFKEIPFKLAGLEITAFEVPHDGTDNAGFSIEYGDKHFVIATDIGHVSERAYHYMTRANYLVIESNYDAHMLDVGKYPEYLKNRIRSANGHLNNADTARFLADNFTENLKYIFLCHLSADNNKPDIACQCVQDALAEKNITVGKGEGSFDDKTKQVQLVALPRYDCSRWFVFRE
jgi:phosphoribosyl 1,2-cyclic phosphodiesterase